MWPRFWLYAIRDQHGNVVYVGATEDLDMRIRQHKGCGGPWLADLYAWLSVNAHAFDLLDTPPTKRAMLDAEREYIEYLRPRFNFRFNTLPADYPLN